MDENLLFFDMAKIIFICVYTVLVIFLLLQLRKMDKVAQPFMISLIIYFICVLVGDLFQYIYNRQTLYETKTNIPEYNFLYLLNLIGVLMTIFGPLYLIYNLEKQAFKKPIIREKHLITILQLVLIVLLGINFAALASMSSQKQDSTSADTIFLLFGGIILIQVLFFFAGFLFLSIKSSGIYRKYTLYISVGYIFQFCVNTYYAFILRDYKAGLFAYSDEVYFNLVGFLWILSLIGLIIMTYGMLKLYFKRKI